MNIRSATIRRWDQVMLQVLDRLGPVSFYARTRGWSFVLAWAHRLTGLLLVLYVWFHLYTLSFLASPPAYDAKMRFFSLFIFVFLEWLLAIPVIFHALNGGRLILYEIFGSRDDKTMIGWVLSLSLAYVFLLGLMMFLGDQTVSPAFFWLSVLVLAAAAAYPVAARILKTGASPAWKLQRITGSFLLIMAPAHMVFMHLQPSTSHESQMVIARMQNGFIKLVDLLLVLAVLYHGGYGLINLAKDYLRSRVLKNLSAFIAVALMVFFGWVGVKLIVLI